MIYLMKYDIVDDTILFIMALNYYVFLDMIYFIIEKVQHIIFISSQE